MLRNQNGSALVFTLIILMALTLLGTIATRTAHLNLIITSNDYVGKKAFYAAESGLSLATAMLPVWGEESEYYAPNPEWVGEVEKDLGDTERTYAYVEHKVGYNPDTDMYEVLRWGDTNNDFKFEENFDVGYPIEYITATGWGGKGNRIAERELSIAVRREPVFISPMTPLYSASNLDVNGAATHIDCEAFGECSGQGYNDIVTTDNAEEGHEASDYVGDYGTFFDSTNEGEYYPVFTVVSRLLRVGEQITGTNNVVLGSIDNTDGIYVYNGDLSINNLEGYGIIAVQGNLEINGNIGWHGIILCYGNLTFGGGGHQYIQGSVIVSGNVLLGGNIEILYDCTNANSLQESTTKYRRLYWQQN